MSAELQGHVAIVTGGASGIGAETCRVLARAGATVIVADVQDALGRETAAGMGPVGNYVHHDVTSEESWRALLEGTLKRFGRLDVLVNNAGISGGMGSIEDTTLETWQHVHAVNSDGVFLGCKIAVEGMQVTSVPKPGIKGSIVNISSIAGIIGSAGPCAYTASKGAVRLLSKSVALHCARAGYDIRCNSVHPAFIDTPMVQEGLNAAPDVEKARKRLLRMVPIGRIGEPNDIGYMILYLASDESKFVTGAEMVVDGGCTAM